MNRSRKLILAGVCMLAVLGPRSMLAHATDAPELKFGSVAMDIPAEMHRRGSELQLRRIGSVG